MPVRSLFLATSLFLLIGFPPVLAQYDTIHPESYFPQPLLPIPVEKNISLQYLNHKAFPTAAMGHDNFFVNLLYDLEKQKGTKITASKVHIEDSLTLQNCITYPTANKRNSPPIPYNTPFEFTHGFRMEHLQVGRGLALELDQLIAPNGFIIDSSRLFEVTMRQCNSDIRLVSNDIMHSFMLAGTTGVNNAFTLFGNRFHDQDGSVFIEGGTFQDDVAIERNYYTDMQINFSADTFYNTLRVDNPLSMSDQVYRGPLANNHLHMEKCFIDGSVRINNNAHYTKIRFNQCQFGPKAYVISLMADTVEFHDCGTLPASLNLQLLHNTDTCRLLLDRTNFSAINFIYGPDIHLAFPSHVLADIYTSTYETLLGKFRTESKQDSYQRLDIEYRNFKTVRGSWWDQTANFLNREWWNYGYSKAKVIRWTLWLLGIFFLLNILLWKPLQEMYPMDQSYVFIDRQHRPVFYQVQKYVLIFLYTAYLFFSVKVDLQKLTVTSLLLLGYFFFQFLVGLGCLFFIVNAILKIG